MKNKQLFGYLFLLPLVLAIWAGWQIFRTTDRSDSEAQAIAEIQNAITEIQVMEKENPTQTLQLEGAQYAMTPNVALTFLEKDLKSAKNRDLESTLKKALAPLALLTALTAMLIAALTFLKVKGA